MKTCINCKISKPKEEFYNKRKTKSGVSLNARCIPCVNKYTKDYYSIHTDKKKENSLTSQLSKYGLTPSNYRQMVENQQNKCKVCKTDGSLLKRRLYVDHCHITGKVRGLLCHSCNVALGAARDDISILRALIQYLTDTST